MGEHSWWCHTYSIDLESSYGSLDWSESNNKLYGGFDAIARPYHSKYESLREG